MACLSSSPSERGRRLSELLEEKQEPFFLDIYLLEKGCSTKLLEPYDTAKCWPGNESRRLKRLTSRGFRSRRSSGGGVLRFLLSKILNGKPMRKLALDWDSGKNSPEVTKICSSSCSRRSDAIESDGVPHLKFMEEEEEEGEDEDAKQLSPVSVLEHPFDNSLVQDHNEDAKQYRALMHDSPKKAMNIFKELLEVAYTPALINQLAKSNEYIKDSSVWDFDDEYHLHSETNNHDKKLAKDSDEVTIAWESYKEELLMVSKLIGSEIPGSKLGARDVQPQRREVGSELEAAIFEELREELLLELMKEMDHAAVERC